MLIKNITKEEFLRLVSPCKNRNATLLNNNDGTVLINGNMFGTMNQCEEYLIDIGRVDLIIH